MRQWVRSIQCRLFGHAGFYREWEWSGLHPYWKERTDVWTCIRCHAEVETLHSYTDLYRVPRPVLDTHVIDIINSLTDVEQIDAERIRVRGGDVKYRERITHTTGA